jgi:hypothetical protein
MATATGVEATIRDEICLSRAKSISVYINPIDLAGYNYWGDYKYDVQLEEAIQDCWYYQLGYWIIEDVLSTVGATNAGSKQVFTSPVKRLMYVCLGEDRTGVYTGTSSIRRQAVPTATIKSQSPRPSYLDPQKGEGFAAEPHTGRLGDEDVDVMHFSLSVIIEIDSILPFMKELCSAKKHQFKGFHEELPEPQTFVHNQITILSSGFYSFENSEPFHFLYRYGKNPAVELELVCEYIFNKQAYEKIKPEEVKGVKDPKQAGAR